MGLGDVKRLMVLQMLETESQFSFPQAPPNMDLKPLQATFGGGGS